MRIVILGGNGASTNIIYNKVSERYAVEKVLLEGGVSRKRFLKKRIRKLGVLTVIGQIMFMALVVPFLKRSSAARIADICEEYGLDCSDAYQESDKCAHIGSVNSEECRQLLRKLKPDLVIVNGTRIIGRQTLSCVSAPFVNMHMGITPKYRGVHGGYWALYNGDSKNAGVTIHFVNEGIDTGGIIHQERIHPKESDNFATYPYLQLGIGVALQVQAIEEISRGECQVISNDLPSHLYSHPTLLQYLAARALRHVK